MAGGFVVKVMWDFHAFPVWQMSASGGNVYDVIGAKLQRDFQAWSDRVTDAMWGPDGPDAPGWNGPGAEVVARLNAQGRELAGRLQQELGGIDEAVVEYDPIAG